MSWFKRDRQPRAESAPTLSPLASGEQQWISANLAILSDLGVDLADPGQLGDLYDAQLGQWEPGGENVGQDPNPTINLIGLGLGEHLARRCGLRWCVATDARGAEIAIHRQPGDILIYPTNTVAKRWVAREYGFLPGFADHIAIQVATIRHPGS